MQQGQVHQPAIISLHWARNARGPAKRIVLSRFSAPLGQPVNDNGYIRLRREILILRAFRLCQRVRVGYRQKGEKNRIKKVKGKRTTKNADMGTRASLWRFCRLEKNAGITGVFEENALCAAVKATSTAILVESARSRTR